MYKVGGSTQAFLGSLDDQKVGSPLEKLHIRGRWRSVGGTWKSHVGLELAHEGHMQTLLVACEGMWDTFLGLCFSCYASSAF